jgi:hypothetical protein
LLVERAIPPALLANNEDFRRAVLNRFREELIGRLTEQIEPATCRRLLDLLSILGPVRLDNEARLDVMAEFLNLARSELVRDFGILEEAGVLLRRGYTLRLIPDVLADYVLHQACVTSQGNLTGFADQMYERFRTTYTANVLRNLAELDWRIRSTSAHGPDVFADVWSSIERDFSEGSDGVRYSILNNLQEVAFYQPGRVLPLIEQVMQLMVTPASSSDHKSVAERLLYGSRSHDDLLHLLPKLLQLIAHRREYLPRCCDLLWQLGRNDPRRLNSTSGHGIRVLQDLAAYDLGKPLSVITDVVESVGRWLQEPDAHTHVHSPLDVLDCVFEKSAHSDLYRGNVVHLRPFFVPRERTQAIRDCAFELLTTCTTSPNLKVVLRAIESLAKVATPVREYTGLTATPEVEAGWLPEQIRALDMLAALISADSHPHVLLRVAQSVGFLARYRRSPQLSQRAREIVTAIPDSYELRLTKALVFSPGDAWTLDDEVPTTADGHAERFQRQQQVAQVLRREVATQFIERNPDPERALTELNTRLFELEEYKVDSHPGMFLSELGTVNVDFVVGICEALIGSPAGPVTPYLPMFLSAVRGVDVERAMALALRVEETGDADLCRALANSQTWGNWAEPPLPVDLDLLRRLANHPHPAVKQASLHTLATLASRQPGAVRDVIDIALSVDIGEEPTLADALCSIFHAQLGVPPDQLTNEELTTVLGRLLPAKQLGAPRLDGVGRGVSAFLSYAAGRVSAAVIQLFIDRLDYADRVSEPGYEPVPYHVYDLDVDLDLSGLTAAEDYEDILRRVRDHALEGSKASKLWIRQLFPIVSLGFGAPSLTVLSEWMYSGDARRIEAVSSLLTEAPPSFVFEQEAFTRQLLERAHAAGVECYQRVKDDLFRCATLLEVSRAIGESSAKLIEVRDNARSAAAHSAVGTPAHRFYTEVAEWAEHQLEHEALRDEEIMDY